MSENNFIKRQKNNHRNFHSKLVRIFLVCSLTLTYQNVVFAEADDELNTNSVEPLETKNIGSYLLSKIVDANTGKPLEKVKVISSLSEVITDQKGEFFIHVSSIEDYILIKLDNYKETSIKVSSIKGKIKLELTPNYLPMFPNLSANINYNNLAFNESYNNFISKGRFNDSFGLDISGKLSSFILELNYQNMGASLLRTENKDKSDLANSLINLKAGYVFSIIKDTVEIAPSIKGFWHNTSIANQTFNQDDPRDKDYLDYSNQKLGVGLDLNIASRPIKYMPLVLGGYASYYPLISLSQDQGGTLPTSLNGFDYGIYLRYDLLGAFLQAKYSSKSYFQDTYNSSTSGFSIGAGYGF